MSIDVQGVASLRRAAKGGQRMAVASALPPEALELVLQQLGCARAFAATCAGDGSLGDALDGARAALGGDPPVVDARDALLTVLAS